MSKRPSYKQIISEIEKLDEIYKERSKELVECNSFSKEQKLKEEMFECEVKKKVLKRKLDSIKESA